MARRLEHIYTLAVGTGHLGRFIIFGSFVTTKPDPGDVDIFLLMEDTFDVRQISGETALIFDHVRTYAVGCIEPGDSHLDVINRLIWANRTFIFGKK